MSIVDIEKIIAEMPIGAGLPKLADIRKGTRDQASGAMEDLDHFRVVFAENFQHLEPYFAMSYGNVPVTLNNAFLIGGTRLEAFSYWMEEHTASKLVHQCDGETQHKHYDKSLRDGKGGIDTEPIPCVAPQCKCKYVGRLAFLLPDFSMATGYMGYFLLHTSSFYDIKSINAHLRDLEHFNGGTLASLPITIFRAPTKISRPNPKKPGERMRTPAWLVHLMVTPGMTKHVLAPGISHDAYAIAAGEMTVDGEIVEQAALPPGDPPPAAEMLELPDEVEGMDSMPEPTALWDFDTVANRTSHAFDNPVHQENAMRQMMRNQELLPDLTDDEAVKAVLENRRRRTAEEVAKAEAKAAAGLEAWNSTPAKCAKFIKAVEDKFHLNPGQIIKAMNGDPDEAYEIRNIQDYRGSKERAWACCIAIWVDYKLDNLAKVNLDDETRALVTELIQRLVIPF